MMPLLAKDTSVIMESKEMEQYKSGDILCYKDIATGNVMMRTVAFLDDEHTKMLMVPMNTKYPENKTDMDSIVVIGKVVKVMSELN